MSSIPPNFQASIIQTQAAQQRATEARQKETNADRLRSRDTSFADKLQDVIENTDRDSSVHSDAEGAGSQGRAFADDAESGAATATDEKDDGSIGTGGGLDVQA